MTPPYDPWRDLRDNWPEYRVIIEPMADDLLGVVRRHPPVIALRADTSLAQRRCTLTHELVHLERGIRDCGPWQGREEFEVHREVAYRLIPIDNLARAVLELGGTSDVGALAEMLHVDSETLRLRLQTLDRSERLRIRRRRSELWSVA